MMKSGRSFIALISINAGNPGIFGYEVRIDMVHSMTVPSFTCREKNRAWTGLLLAVSRRRQFCDLKSSDLCAMEHDSLE